MTIAIVFVLLCAVAAGQSWQGVERVVAVGDVHGSYREFTTLLRQAGLLESTKDTWAGGKAHLVQLGDIPDRAPDTRRILDLLMNLEKQAKKAGGMVHALIGNHEAMNLYGDLRYVTPEEFASFARPDSGALRSEYWRMHVADLEASGQRVKATPAYQAEWEKQHPLGFVEHRFEFGPNGKYGKWIRKHNAVIRINDTLFVHGGISAKYGRRSIRDINDQVRRELADWTLLDGGMVLDSDGPLWYRGLAVRPEAELQSDVDDVLAFHGVRRIVAGHTPTSGAIIPRFGRKVLLADVGLSAAYGSRQACLVIEGDKLVALHRGVAIPLPESSADVVAYLRKAAAADPAPSPLVRLIKAMEGAGAAMVQVGGTENEPAAIGRVSVAQ